ncbi:hypothetical protein ACP275_02G129300 [Erythranthe tilingii]
MVKSFSGSNSISNAFHSSKLLINENLEEHREYREKLMMQAGTFSQSISQISTQRSIGISEDLLQTEHMTISDLMDCTSERSVALLAKVVEIDCESKWWYPSCSKCFKKVDCNGVQFYCEKCIDNVPSIPRYRIQVLVFDVTGSISLVMFDKVVTQIIGKKAADILGDLEKEDLTDAVPNEFDALIDKEFIFKVDIGAMNIFNNWSVYTVKTVSGDDELIQKFRAMHSIQPYSDEDDQSVGNDVQQQDDNLDV